MSAIRAFRREAPTPEPNLELQAQLAIATESALCVIARVARWVGRGEPVPELDGVLLDAAARFFDVPGCYRRCADARYVAAMETLWRTGRTLEPIDLDRLRRINARAHAALARLDARADA